MQAHRISARLWFSAPDGLDLEHFTPVFHGWIRENKLEDEVMIDVADYAHVEAGPGVLLVCHEGHYVIERRGDRWALCYHRKRGGETDDLDTRLAVPLRRLVAAAKLLEGDPELPGRLTFETEAVELEIRSRLHVSNDPDTRASLLPLLEAALSPRFAGNALELESIADDPRQPVTVRARLATAPPLAKLVA
jgi:hypothetical protein